MSARRIAVGLWLLLGATGCGAKEFEAVPAAPAEPAEPDAVVFLIGDAGLAAIDDPIIQQLRGDVAQAAASAPTFVVYLGDNVYERGLHPPAHPDHEKEKSYLDAQAFVVRGTQARAIFIPGNHDWGYSDERGIEQIRRQAAYIEELAAAGVPVEFQPPAGCPGPVSVQAGTRVLMLLLETDLWLRDDEPLESCANRSTDAALIDLEGRMRENTASERRHVLVLGHHPLESYGPHGGYYTFQDYLFPGTRLWKPLFIPLPFLYPLIRNMGVSSQDLSSSRYKAMVAQLAAVFLAFPDDPLIYGSGHGHSLQVIEGAQHGVDWLLVSGAGSKLTPVVDGDPLFAAGAQHGEHGYMRLTFFADGRVLLVTISDGTKSCADDPDGCVGEAKVRYWRWLVE